MRQPGPALGCLQQEQALWPGTGKAVGKESQEAPDFAAYSPPDRVSRGTSSRKVSDNGLFSLQLSSPLLGLSCNFLRKAKISPHSREYP